MLATIPSIIQIETIFNDLYGDNLRVLSSLSNIKTLELTDKEDTDNQQVLLNPKCNHLRDVYLYKNIICPNRDTINAYTIEQLKNVVFITDKMFECLKIIE